MADRKKNQKGARKAAVSKPKAEARKKTAAVKTATPRKLAQQAGIQGTAATAVAGSLAQPLIQAGVHQVAADYRVAGDVQQASAIIAGVGGVQVDAEIRNRVTRPTDNVARVLELISTTLVALRSRHGPDGDNQASERDEAIDDFELYIRLGNTTIRVVQEQTQSQAPSKAVVEQNAAAFETVEVGAKSFLRRLSELAGVGLGAAGRGALQEVGKMAADQIGALLLELPNLIGALHHWANLIT